MTQGPASGTTTNVGTERRKLFWTINLFTSLQVYNGKGELLKTWSDHACRPIFSCPILEVFISGQQYIAISCKLCKQIKLYSSQLKSAHIGYDYQQNADRMDLDNMCLGPGNTIMVCNQSWQGNSVCLFDSSTRPLKLQREIKTRDLLQNIHYSEGCLFTTHAGLTYSDMICATDFHIGKTLWKVDGDQPRTLKFGMCTDQNGRLYIGDGTSNHLLVFHVTTGKLIQSVNLNIHPFVGSIHNLAWDNSHPRLIMKVIGKSWGEEISYCNVV